MAAGLADRCGWAGGPTICGRNSMSTMWVRLDTGLPDHPKMLALIHGKKHKAALAYVLGLSYSGRHGLDGYIPTPALPFIHATKAEAIALCEVGLWHARDGGYEINDWSEYQVSNEETQARKQRARDAANKKWGNA